MAAHPTETQLTIVEALAELERYRQQRTDGRWLEQLTVRCAPLIAEWDIATCWVWDEWPDSEWAKHSDEPKPRDIGIDAVGRRRSDGKYVAIQCKSRKLDDAGRGSDITKAEADSFLALSGWLVWEERWVVVNGGDVRLSPQAEAAADRTKPLKLINLESELRRHRQSDVETQPETCPHCDDPTALQTRDCMQREAVEAAIVGLSSQAESVGFGRGRIILPCGTGKSRIALRIVEQLTSFGCVSAVLCPSIALVAQLRREFLNYSVKPFKALAVCSDSGVARDPSKVDLARQPTADAGGARASEVKGSVTTDPARIRAWIDEVSSEGDRFGIIFGTYQSSRSIADALTTLGSRRQLSVLIADEAHRTAGLRPIAAQEAKLRDFTVCHDDVEFPVKYRIYQTATPRVYNVNGDSHQNGKWIVRNMDDQQVFGVELYRRSYAEAVGNRWLSDYRIIALGVNDSDAYETANALAAASGKSLSAAQFLKGLTLVLALAGAARLDGVELRSSINFMNTVSRSKAMAAALQSQAVRDWVQQRLRAEVFGSAAAYTLEHLDASHRVSARESAKARLAAATTDKPHGILNVGIFGEGTDAPSLSAVGFLEPRKSPVDVIQAVGRVMRRTEGKDIGYVICPILIPPGVDAETWLRNSGPEDGWRELGQILLALRAHDSRIETDLGELMQIYLPSETPEVTATFVTLGGIDSRVRHFGHVGVPDSVNRDLENVLNGLVAIESVLRPLSDVVSDEGWAGDSGLIAERIVGGRSIIGGGVEIREAALVRTKPQADGSLGAIDVVRCKAAGVRMVNGNIGVRVRRRSQRRPRSLEERVQGLFDRVDPDSMGITLNLLNRSGLRVSRAERDVNVLRESIQHATRYLREDELDSLLDCYFGLNHLDTAERRRQADGCTIASLLLMNAAMLHQRVAVGKWFKKVVGLGVVKNAQNPIRYLTRQWHSISRYDFLPVLMPAIEVIEAIEDSGRVEGLQRALRHIAAEAERIAETYADLGSDHAGPLFNKVMGNQASDGAFFSLPAVASLLARLTLDVAGVDTDWTSEAAWLSHRTLDLACGSGTLLAAVLAEMIRRAREQGVSGVRLATLKRLAIEELIVGLDFNAVSLQLAAAQLIANSRHITFRKMSLHQMPYGPAGEGCAAGSLELIAQQGGQSTDAHLGCGDERLTAEPVSLDIEIEEPVAAAHDARIVVMNPPFTNRTQMGKKFSKDIQSGIRARVDALERSLVSNDPGLEGFVDKNSIRPMFTALAERCLNQDSGILAMIVPTIALTATSGVNERRILANRFHIHTLLTCHRPSQINLSQNTNINESIVIACRHKGTKPATRVVSLDRLPRDEIEAEELHLVLSSCVGKETLSEGWGEVSEWPADRISSGDWTATVWRSPNLAEASFKIANDERLTRLVQLGLNPVETGRILRGKFRPAGVAEVGGFPIIKSKGAKGQRQILAKPDAHWIARSSIPTEGIETSGTDPETEKLLRKSAHLLVTAGQDTSTARLTAVASESAYVGNGWMPILGATVNQSKAIAVFLNSTAGRVQLMRNPGRTLRFPNYSAEELGNIRIPDLSDEEIVLTLANCWESTADMIVPQFRDGECEVRRMWDDAVAEALVWNSDELADLRMILHREPFVRGLGVGEYGGEIEKSSPVD